tara:strand:+ start:415 stop:1644 length:1230 start_codon:yes stop_codon:yes gene_type:complete
MNKTKNSLLFLFLVNISTLLSYFINYSESEIFEVNFNSLNLNQIELFYLYNFLSIILYFVVSYVYRFQSVAIQYSVTFLFFQLSIVLIFWIIKFVNLSRIFFLSSFIIFYILIIFLSRLTRQRKEEFFITFDKEINKEFPNVILTNAKNFPRDFLAKVSSYLKKQNLKGIIYSNAENIELNFESIVDVSNFLGIDIYEEKDKKFNLIHKSTSINKPLKNFEDILLLIFFGIPIIILILLISVIVLIFQGRPIFYKQLRVGEGGNYFFIYKFRTMNNLKLTQSELENLNERDKIVFKSSNDPRITTLGKFLRKSSIDELPQVINIFKNEMSFIGPRPPIVEEVDQYELKHLKRISIKPGITGLWQVTLRQDNDFERWVRKDIEYIENWSILRDIKILFLTILEIFRLSGE